ncbi:hypothetical protein CKO31_14230 [Thiohalocapsa halophila]|uniref:Asparagine synthetase domain-containing protein n=1 Tax=Thiohalocapsa halophila TaxID=69359 RepID=A0ABS1CKL1_9GAMM|nr:hypothetical protein [Thiohalocapsa halophila]
MVASEHALSVVYGPLPSLLADGLSFCLGAPANPGPTHLAMDAPAPDGTFALLRCDGHAVKASTDYTASRSIWYCLTEDAFVVSTSQRMLVAALGSYQPNTQALGWFLASGTLGPENAWDARAQLLPGNSTIRFDPQSWRLDLQPGGTLTVREVKRPDLEHEQRLRSAVDEAAASMISEDQQWVLALSGGMDSRSLLYYLQEKGNVEAVTWGLRDAPKRPDSDAALAIQLAQQCGLKHSYWVTDIEQANLEKVFARFVAAGEGRLDHLSGYMDGLALWARLSAKPVTMIRGYDAFGSKGPARNEYQARDASTLLTADDFRDAFLPDELRASPDQIPQSLGRRPSESLADWRDRLWLEYRTPYVTASLDDIKFAYTEVVNPLLSRPVVETFQQLPEHMRTHKRVFRHIVEQMFPGVPFARRDSVQHIGSIARQSDVKTFLADKLRAAGGDSILPVSFSHWLANNLDQGEERIARRRRVVATIRTYMPQPVQDMLRAIGHRTPRMDARRVAIRAVLADLATKQLAADASFHHRSTPQ